MHRCYARIASGAHDPTRTLAGLESRTAQVLTCSRPSGMLPSFRLVG
jgi:hypothetical protein